MVEPPRLTKRAMERVKIRTLTAEDLPTLARLYSQFWGHDSDLAKMRTTYEQMAPDPRHILLCATVDEAVVGSILGVVCQELYGTCRPFLVIEDLIVDEGFRRKGIGGRLMTELLDRARRHGCAQVQFITEAVREEAVAFYRSLGYDPGLHVGFKKSL